MDWLETPRPTGMSLNTAQNRRLNPYTEVRQYVLTMLLHMVEFHSQVSATSKLLLDRTMNALVSDITTEALRCFKQIRRFGMGGMLRVRLTCAILGHPAHHGGAGNTRNRVHASNPTTIRLTDSSKHIHRDLHHNIGLV